MSTSASASGRSSSARRPVIARIAAGIDGFPEGRDAAALGQSLAKATGAELMLVAVHSTAPLPTPPELSYGNLRKQSQVMLREVRDSLAPGARTLTATDHSVPRALHRVVHRHHCDLLVVGSSRQGPEGRVRIGKRTRQSAVPLRVRARSRASRPARQAPARPPPDRRGLRRRSRVGGRARPRRVDRVRRRRRSACAGGGRRPASRVRPIGSGRLVEDEWNEAISAEMDELRGRAVAAGERIKAQLEVEVARGRPADLLLELSQHVDLLVIGSREWGPRARLLLGSTGEALMHDSACAVLAVPRPPS